MLAQVYIAVFSFLYGDAKRLVYGYDSFGNICNQEYNAPIKNMPLSGRNTSGMPWVLCFLFIVSFVLHSCITFGTKVKQNSNFYTLFI